MKETQQQIDMRKEAIAFAEWIRDNDIYPTGDAWNYLGSYYSTEQLYSLFKYNPCN